MTEIMPKFSSVFESMLSDPEDQERIPFEERLSKNFSPLLKGEKRKTLDVVKVNPFEEKPNIEHKKSNSLFVNKEEKLKNIFRLKNQEKSRKLSSSQSKKSSVFSSPKSLSDVELLSFFRDFATEEKRRETESTRNKKKNSMPITKNHFRTGSFSSNHNRNTRMRFIVNNMNKDDDLFNESILREYSKSIRPIDQEFKNQRTFLKLDKKNITQKKVTKTIEKFLKLYMKEESTGKKLLQRDEKGNYSIFSEKSDILKNDKNPFFFRRQISSDVNIKRRKLSEDSSGKKRKEKRNLSEQLISKCKSTFDKSTSQFNKEKKHINKMEKKTQRIFLKEHISKDKWFLLSLKKEIRKEKTLKHRYLLNKYK